MRRALGPEPALVLLLLLISLAFRTYHLEQAPPGLQHDEAFNSHDAVLVLQGVRPVFFAANYGREAFFIYLMAGFIAILGHNAVAIRLTGVTCGLIGQILLYLLIRKLFGHRAGIMVLAVSAISFWHIFDSRLGLRAISLPMMLTLSLYCLWHGVFDRQRGYWLLSGITLGLTTYTYLAARVAPLVPVVFLLYLALTSPRTLRGQSRSIILWALAALVVFAPFGAYMLHHLEAATARLQELRYPVDQLRRGNLQPALISSLRTFGMILSGDPEWRYNLPRLPVFDAVAAVFFCVGLFLCVYRWRDARRAFLLIWMMVMLLPSMLSDSAPSWLRSIGALPPILAMPALGFAALLDYVRRQKPRTMQNLVLLALVIWFAVSGVATYRNYFLVWARAAEPRSAYEADMAEVARYLNSLTDQPLICISTDFAYDLDRYVLTPQLSRVHDIKWFDGRRSFVLPAVPGGSTVLYIFTAAAPLSSFIAERYFAGMEPIYQPLDPRGIPVLTVYRHSSGSLPRLRALEPAIPLRARLGEDITLLGYERPADAKQGDRIRVIVYWQTPQPFARDYSDAPSFILHVRDSDGRFWTQADSGTGYPAWDWSAGDIAVSWFEVSAAGDWPLQPYWIHFGTGSSGTRLPVFDEVGQKVGDELRLDHPIQLTAALAPLAESSLPIRTRSICDLAGDVSLRGYTVDDEVKPGQEVTLVLFWQALAKPSKDYGVHLRLTDSKDHVLFTKADPLWPTVYPTSQWHPGVFVRSYHTLMIPPNADSGILSLGIHLVDAAGEALAEPPCAASVARLVVKARQRIWQLPAGVQHSLHAELGSGVSLLGYTLQPEEVASGGTLHLTLYWQCRAGMSTGYTVFTHVLGPDNLIVGQKDSPPGSGASPTTSWLVGEIIVDRYDLPIKPDAPAGEYLVEIGMYDPANIERLPVIIDGKEDPERRVLLGKASVRGK